MDENKLSGCLNEFNANFAKIKNYKKNNKKPKLVL